MKRRYLLVVFLLMLVHNIYAQDSIYQAVNKQVCSCITAKSFSSFSLKDYRFCITQALNAHMNSIMTELKKKNTDSTNYYNLGFRYGQAIGSRLDTDLIYTCDAYFRIADTIRANTFRVQNKDSLRQLLVAINSPDVPKDISFYNRRAVINFLLGLTDDANKDAEEVLKQQPDYIAALVIHASFLEANKEYAYAAAIYYQLDKITGEHAYLVSAAINSRKNKELNRIIK